MNTLPQARLLQAGSFADRTNRTLLAVLKSPYTVLLYFVIPHWHAINTFVFEQKLFHITE